MNGMWPCKKPWHTPFCSFAFTAFMDICLVSFNYFHIVWMETKNTPPVLWSLLSLYSFHILFSLVYMIWGRYSFFNSILEDHACHLVGLCVQVINKTDNQSTKVRVLIWATIFSKCKPISTVLKSVSELRLPCHAVNILCPISNLTFFLTFLFFILRIKKSQKMQFGFDLKDRIWNPSCFELNRWSLANHAPLPLSLHTNHVTTVWLEIKDHVYCLFVW